MNQGSQSGILDNASWQGQNEIPVFFPYTVLSSIAGAFFDSDTLIQFYRPGNI
jgi:hypothetical protein